MSATHIRANTFRVHQFGNGPVVRWSLPAPPGYPGVAQRGHYTPGIYKYVRTLGFSLKLEFLASLICANSDLPGIDSRHDAYDSHWLRLKQIRERQHTDYLDIGALDNTVHYEWWEKFQFHLASQNSISSHEDRPWSR